MSSEHEEEEEQQLYPVHPPASPDRDDMSSSSDHFPSPQKMSQTIGYSPRHKAVKSSPRPTTARSFTYSRELPEPSTAIITYMQRALDEKSLAGISEDTLEQVILYLNDERKKRAAKRAFKDGARYNKAIRYTSNYLESLKKKQLQKEFSSIRTSEFQEFKTEFDEFDNETQRLITDLDTKLKNARKQMLESHVRNLDDLQRRWNSPAKQRLYNRATNALICLKRQQALLLIENRFDDAAEVELLIKERTKQEEEINTKQRKHDFYEAETLVKDKQAEELAKFDESARIQMQQLKQKRARLRVAYENRETKLKHRVEDASNEDRVWNSCQMQRTNDASSGMRAMSFAPPKITKKDLKMKEFTFLALPPLRSSTRRSPKKRRSISVE